MPKYNVPAIDFSNVPDKPEKHQPSIYIPMKPEWIGKLKLGEKIEITLKGKVKGTHVDNSENYPRSEVEVALDVVSYYKSEDQVGKFLREADKAEEG